MKIPVIVALDEETYRLWQKIPNQQKSKTVREWLTGRKEQTQDFQSLAESLTHISEKPYPEPNSSKNHALYSSETARTGTQKPKTYSSRKHTDNMTELLQKV